MQRDPWTDTLSLLRHLPELDRRCLMRETRRPYSNPCTCCGRPDGLKVSVTGRPSPTTVSVNWCSVSSGHYGDQIWRYAIASRPGICAFSGETINVGDAIYIPRFFRTLPANADAMILAIHIERTAADLESDEKD